MAVLEWKKFDFFNLKENVSESATKLLTGEEGGSGEITCIASGQSQKVLCDSNGSVFIFYRNWKQHNVFQAHETGTPIVLCEVTQLNNHLVTVGYKGLTAEIKIWNLAKARNRQVPCLKSFKSTIQRQKPTALAVVNNGVNSQIFLALGFERGDLVLYKGDPTKSSDFSYTALAIFTISSKKITGIAFNLIGKSCHLFICSDNGILSYEFNSQLQLQQNSEKEFSKIILDRKSEPSRCCTLQKDQDSYFLVGRDDAIYCFTSDGRGPCYALDGQKVLIKCFGNYLVTVLKTNKPQPINKDYTLIVIDILNKFKVFSSPIEEITGIFSDDSGSNNGCFLLSKSKIIYHLNEKDLESKLSLLFKKKLFDIAVKISKDHKLQKEESDEEAMAEIYKLYGDHLYFKGNYNASVEKYIKTIPFLEPSYVIKKFLDSRHISCLVEYLQALSDAGVASDEHKKLLKNCFKRLELPNKIESPAHSPIEDGENLLLSTDLESMREILQEMSSIDVEVLMKNNACEITKKDPLEAVRLFTGICEDHPDIEPDFFIPYFSKDQRKELIEFLEYFINKTDNETVYNTLIEFYLQQFSENKTDEDSMLEKLTVFEGKYNKEFVLILCRFYKFWPGILYIYEEKDLHNLSIRYYHQRKDYSNMIKSCETFGNNNPNLWIQALNCSDSKDSNALPTNVLLQVLGVISREKLLSPLQVAEALCVENGPKVGQLKDYFLQMFKKENETLTQETDEVRNLRNDVISLTDYIQNCKENPLEFGNTFCNACNQPLTLPSIYYICRHAFHQDCVKNYSANEKDCSVCMKDNLHLNELIQRSTSHVEEHDSFHNVLDRSKDHLQVLSQYFSRGLFNKICIVDETGQSSPPPVRLQTRNIETARDVARDLPKPTVSLNPFGEDEDSYDKEKNPFENDDDTSDHGIGNPFEVEGYDSNLNPFN
ncbi:VPS11 family protein [Megaselia abdita]